MQKTWTCVCGKTHQIKEGEPIYCIAPGHHVYLSPDYFNYGKLDSAQQKDTRLAPAKFIREEEGQQSMF